MMRIIAYSLALLIATASVSEAAMLRVVVQDGNEDSVEYAVASLTPLDDGISLATNGDVVLEQEDLLFNPFVASVTTGGTVRFTNNDSVRHHVYSFAGANNFELRLFGRDEVNELTFDTPGAVPIGCNIHDNMLAFIYVTDAPAHQATGPDGSATFEDLPIGRYRLSIWHPDLEGEPRESDVTVSEAVENETVISVALSNFRQEQLPASSRYD